jgi:polyisoprenoid-binding protein YceI
MTFRQLVALAALVTTLIAVPAHALEYTDVDLAASRVQFTFKEMGVGIDGSFKKFSAKVHFDPKKLTAAAATVDLDMASVDAGSDEANDEVVGKAWFNTKAFPAAHFAADSVTSLGGNRYQVSGKLTIKGHTQVVSAPFTIATQGKTATCDGSFVIHRADFSIGEGIWADFGTVANDIAIRFHWQLLSR